MKQLQPSRRHLHHVSSAADPSSSHSKHQQSHLPQTFPPRSAITIPCRHRPVTLLLLVLTCFVAFSTAGKISLSEQMGASRAHHERHANEDVRSTLHRLAQAGTIMVDSRPPPNPGAWMLVSEHDALIRRAENKTSPGNATKPSSTNTGIATAATQGPVVLPTPFDSGYASNLTQSCADFMSGFLASPDFKACLPLSMLLQNSNSFFQASKSLVRITQTLDATCSANATFCTTLTKSLATNLTSANNCASDLASRNPLIEQAHFGLLAYRVLFTASCLRNARSSSYCYADAITNAANPSGAFIYYLPLNVTLPGGSQPTCDSCVKETMNVFGAATSDRKSAIASTYASAAMQVNVQCGPGFVNSSLAAAVAGNAAGSLSVPVLSTVLLALVMTFVGGFL